MRHFISVLIIVFLSWCGTHAQSDLGVHFMRGVWQSNVTNPAFLPDHRVIVALPGIQNEFSLDNFSYNDLIDETSDGRSVLQIDRVLELLRDENTVRTSLSIPTFSVAVRIGDGGLISAGHSLRVQASAIYPRELPSLLWRGNAQFIGQEINIGPNLLAQSFQEIFVGGAIPIGEYLTLGARVKFLSGNSGLETSRTDLRLFTSDDVYQSTLIADYQLNSTGIVRFNSFSDNSFELPDRPFSGFGSGNSGLAFDVGAVTQFGPVTITASALDLGSLVWKNEVENQILSGTFTYEGLDILEESFLDSINIGSVTDTLEALYDVQTTNANFTTSLPARFFVSASYQLTNQLRFGGLLYGELNRGTFFPALAASVHWDAARFLSIGGVYSVRRESYLNLGVHTAVRLGPVLLVAATDNILTAIQPGDSQTAHFRVGLNLGFGYLDPDQRQGWNREETFFR